MQGRRFRAYGLEDAAVGLAFRAERVWESVWGDGFGTLQV